MNKCIECEFCKKVEGMFVIVNEGFPSEGYVQAYSCKKKYKERHFSDEETVCERFNIDKNLEDMNDRINLLNLYFIKKSDELDAVKQDIVKLNACLNSLQSKKEDDRSNLLKTIEDYYNEFNPKKNIIEKYIDVLKTYCEENDESFCSNKHCDICLIEVFLEFVKINPYYFDDVLGFLYCFNNCVTDGIYQLPEDEKYWICLEFFYNEFFSKNDFYNRKNK